MKIYFGYQLAGVVNKIVKYIIKNKNGKPVDKFIARWYIKQKSKLTTEKLFKILICIKSFEIFM